VTQKLQNNFKEDILLYQETMFFQRQWRSKKYLIR